MSSGRGLVGIHDIFGGALSCSDQAQEAKNALRNSWFLSLARKVRITGTVRAAHPLHAASVSFEENTKAGCSSTPTKRVFRKARSWADDGCDRVLLCRWSSRARALHRLISPVADRSSAASSELRFANLSDRLEAGKTLFSRSEL